MTKLRGWVAAILVAALHGVGVPAGAQVTTQDGASVLVFPRVISDDNWETTIQIGNGANRPMRAVCRYVNGALEFPDQRPGPLNEPLWTETDFTIALERVQPTHWTLSTGRLLDPDDNPCRPGVTECDGAGVDPGIVPPVLSGFTGELICFEVDASGAPWSGNALRGQATLTHRQSGEVSKYPAVGLAGLPSNDADGTLCLGGEAGGPCPKGAEYLGCPRVWDVSHRSDFDDRSVDGDASSTRLTVVPCSQDLATQQPTTLTLQFIVTNELEQTFSASSTVRCWAVAALGDVNPIFTRDALGTDWVQTRIRSSNAMPLGFLLVQQTERRTARPASFTVTAAVPHQQDVAAQPDLIVVPEENLE